MADIDYMRIENSMVLGDYYDESGEPESCDSCDRTGLELEWLHLDHPARNRKVCKRCKKELVEDRAA